MEVYGLLAAGYGDWPIIKQISWLLGQVMNGIYNVMSGLFGIENIGICIIIFTIIVYSFMIPLTIKQQKFSKMSAVMQPEIRKIQKKYEGKKDQASMLKQQEEMKLVYEKYGTSMSGGCLPLLILCPFIEGFLIFQLLDLVTEHHYEILDLLYHQIIVFAQCPYLVFLCIAYLCILKASGVLDHQRYQPVERLHEASVYDVYQEIAQHDYEDKQKRLHVVHRPEFP